MSCIESGGAPAGALGGDRGEGIERRTALRDPVERCIDYGDGAHFAGGDRARNVVGCRLRKRDHLGL